MKKIVLLITLSICQNLYCQVFDNELINNVSDREDKKESLEQVPIGSPHTEEINTHSHLGNSNPKIDNNTKKIENEQGLSIEELSKIGTNTNNPNSIDGTFKTPSNNLESNNSSNDLVILILFVLLLISVIVVIVVYQKSNTNENIENENTIKLEKNKITKEIDTSKILIELEKIENLKKSGTITDNEFEKLKKEILSII